MYRNIDTKFWSDPKVRSLSYQERYLFLYLLTNHHAHLSGIFYLPKQIAIFESGLDEKAYRKAFDTLVSVNLIKYDNEKEIVWVINMLKYQASNANTLKAADKQLHSVHNTILICDFLDHYHEYKWTISKPIERVSEGFRYPSIPVPVPAPITAPTPEVKKVEKDENPKSEYSENFERFWNEYPRKGRVAKEYCFGIWKKKKLNSKVDQLINAVEKQHQSKKWIDGFIPNMSTWLNQGRWEDEVVTGKGYVESTKTPQLVNELIFPCEDDND